VPKMPNGLGDRGSTGRGYDPCQRLQRLSRGNMKTFAIFIILMCCVSTMAVSCAPIEQQAYRSIVAANAFIKAEYAQHPECAQNPTGSDVCTYLSKANSAKNLVIDAAEAYCAGPGFGPSNPSGACQPPKKGTPGYTQAVAKLQAAMTLYSQAQNDLKGVIH